MASEKYVALHANPKANTPHVDGNYAMYPQGEEPVYFPGTNPYALTPSKAYGKLYFYLGAIHSESSSSPQFYGLCTADGKIVTEPIYTVATLLTDSKGNTAYLCFRSDLARKTLSNPAILFTTDGSWVKDYDDAQFCYGFNGAADSVINADFIAVKKDGQWGAVNMNGETVLPFDRSTPDGIYGQPDFRNSGPELMLGITADRYLASGKLYDAKGRLIADDIKGLPMAAAGNYFVTTDFSAQSAPVVIYTYTLDGKMLAKLESSSELVQWASPCGDYVLARLEDRIKVYDKQLQELYELPLRLDETEHRYAYMRQGAGVLYDSNLTTKFHHTYLPDGTKLVTWYDPDMGQNFAQ